MEGTSESGTNAIYILKMLLAVWYSVNSWDAERHVFLTSVVHKGIDTTPKDVSKIGGTFLAGKIIGTGLYWLWINGTQGY